MATQEEKDNKELKEKRREIALKNLRADGLLNLAATFSAQRDESGFGKADNEAVEKFLYGPSLKGADAYDLKSGNRSDLLYESLLGSREEGRRYSGKVSEYGIIKTAGQIVQESLISIKVEDVMKLAGSKINIKKGYQKKYISDLLESGNEEDKQVAGTLIGGYIQYLTTQRVSGALNQRAEAIRGGLESIVTEEGKKR
jgi:hypothetical protein